MKYETASHAMSRDGEMGGPKDATGCDGRCVWVDSCEKCVAKDAVLNMDYQLGWGEGRDTMNCTWGCL